MLILVDVLEGLGRRRSILVFCIRGVNGGLLGVDLVFLDIQLNVLRIITLKVIEYFFGYFKVHT